MAGHDPTRRGTLLALTALAAAPALPAAAAQGRTHTIIMEKMKFGPAPANLRVGDTVVWVNRDMVRHTATANGLFDVDIAPGASGRAVMRKAGAVPYICRFHPTMTGRLTVAA